eukprot:CAMPEP_0198123902 /NCGR_PEP_ID=MMETSP1442-20131203/38641_1 /TAXON_ID= /ORGANISM="Craspedostauros australis, Strain CCMP3328" /LENGTH=33 /DNA_ID= /DNA_START= /DNA_END= /DNA_ORIENTATION=
MAKMSGAPGGSFGNAGKKAVHVKVSTSSSRSKT